MWKQWVCQTHKKAIMSLRNFLLQFSVCIFIASVALTQAATLNEKHVRETKNIRIAPKRSSYEVKHLPNYKVPERSQKAKDALYACNSKFA